MSRNKAQLRFFVILILIIFCIPCVSTAIEIPINLPYYSTIDFQTSSQAYQYNIQDRDQPPVIISFKVTPQMVTDQKYIMPDPSSTKGYYVTITRPSEFSWCLISVVNSKTNELLGQDGFGGGGDKINFEQSLDKKEFSVRNNGPYSVFVLGKGVTIDLKISSDTASPATTIKTLVPSSTTLPIITTTRPIPSVQTLSRNSWGGGQQPFDTTIILVISSVVAGAIFGIVEYSQNKFIMKKKK